MADAWDMLEGAGRMDTPLWDGEQIDGPDGHMWVRRDSAIQWRDRALAAEAERSQLRADKRRLEHAIRALKSARDTFANIAELKPRYRIHAAINGEAMVKAALRSLTKGAEG